MAGNTLAALAPILYSSARVVPRELVGLLGGVRRDFNDQGVALNDVVKVALAPTLVPGVITPAQVFTVGAGRTPTQKTLTLSQQFGVSWNLNAEEDKSLANAGVGQDLFGQTVTQGLRALVNQIETYVWGIARLNASRSFGTAGTAPFATDLSGLTQSNKILDDNGAPKIDRQMVINTAAGLNLRNLTQLQKVNERGSGDMLNDGSFGRLFDFAVRESAAPVSVAVGTATPYTSSAAGFAAGSTTIALITGSGTILAGDTISFAGDPNKYVVATGLAAPGNVVIQEPGLRQALPASAQAVTLQAAATANLAFDRNAIVAVVRPSLQPQGAIAEQMVISDPVTGLSFLMLRSVGDQVVSYYLRCVYDAFVPNPYAVAVLAG